jgi:hypothetical protein
MKRVCAVIITSLLTTHSFAVSTQSNLFKGDVPTVVNHPLFVSAEGNYTTNSMNSVTVRGTSLSKSTNNWGGRLAAGAIYQASPTIGYTGEIGWGYYGQTKFNSDTLGVNNTATIYGMDLLVGIDYRYNQFDWYAKVGGLNQNVKLDRKTNLSKFVAGGSTVGYTDVTTTVTTVAPEVKVGGIYNVSNCLGISLAYTYVFGNSVNMSYAPSFDGTTNSINTTTNSPPASLSSVSLGLVYRFA